MEAGAEIINHAIIVRVIIQPSHQQNQQRVQIDRQKGIRLGFAERRFRPDGFRPTRARFGIPLCHHGIS
jgi:hypothetical protein